MEREVFQLYGTMQISPSRVQHRSCIQAVTVCQYKNPLVYTDSVKNNVRVVTVEDILNKRKATDLTKPAEPGYTGNSQGLAKASSFSRTRGLAVEFDHNIYVTDSRAGSVKILSTASSTAKFLKHVNNIFIYNRS